MVAITEITYTVAKNAKIKLDLSKVIQELRNKIKRDGVDADPEDINRLVQLLELN